MKIYVHTKNTPISIYELEQQNQTDCFLSIDSINDMPEEMKSILDNLCVDTKYYDDTISEHIAYTVDRIIGI